MAQQPIVKRGFLTKQGSNVKNWKRRFFVLKDGALTYYVTENDLVPKGEMNLYGAAVIFVGPPKVSRYNCLEVSGPTRTLFVSADTQQEAKDWAIAIQKAAIAQTGGAAGLTSSQLLLTAPKKKIDIDKHLAHLESNTTGSTPEQIAKITAAAATPAPAAAGSATAAAAAPAAKQVEGKSAAK